MSTPLIVMIAWLAKNRISLYFPCGTEAPPRTFDTSRTVNRFIVALVVRVCQPLSAAAFGGVNLDLREGYLDRLYARVIGLWWRVYDAKRQVRWRVV